MIFLFCCLIFFVASTAVFIKMKVPYPLSKGAAIATALSLLALISLVHNLVVSFIPEANDGIGISNIIAYWIIGEDEWSTAKFQQATIHAMYISFALILACPVILAAEAAKASRRS